MMVPKFQRVGSNPTFPKFILYFNKWPYKLIWLNRRPFTAKSRSSNLRGAKLLPGNAEVGESGQTVNLLSEG